APAAARPPDHALDVYAGRHRQGHLPAAFDHECPGGVAMAALPETDELFDQRVGRGGDHLPSSRRRKASSRRFRARWHATRTVPTVAPNRVPISSYSSPSTSRIHSSSRSLRLRALMARHIRSCSWLAIARSSGVWGETLASFASLRRRYRRRAVRIRLRAIVQNHASNASGSRRFVKFRTMPSSASETISWTRSGGIPTP